MIRPFNLGIPVLSVLLFIFSRLFILFFLRPDHFSLFPLEELYRGTIAKEILTGLTENLIDYRADTYSGGSLVIGLLAAPLFFWLGDSLFALKMTALLFSAGTLFFWCLLLNRYSAKKTAIIFSIFFIFCPPIVSRYWLTPLGDHPEAAFFTSASLFILFSAFRGKYQELSTSFLGVIGGIGLWFSYTYGITLLVLIGLLITHSIGTKKLPVFLLFCIGFLIGFSPSFFTHDLFHINGEPFWNYFVPLSWNQIDKIHFLGGSFGQFYTFLYGGLLILGLLRINRFFHFSGCEKLFLKITCPHLLLFTLFFLMTPFSSVRYLIFIFPVLIALLALILSGENSQTQKSFLFILIAASLFLHSHILSANDAGRLLKTQGYSYSFLPFSAFCRNFNTCVNRLPDFKEKLSASDYQELELSLAAKSLESVSLERLEKDSESMAEVLPPNLLEQFYYFLGVEITRNFPDLNTQEKLSKINFLKLKPPAFEWAEQGIRQEKAERHRLSEPVFQD